MPRNPLSIEATSKSTTTFSLNYYQRPHLTDYNMNVDLSAEVLYSKIDPSMEVAHSKVDRSSPKEYTDHNMNVNLSPEVAHPNIDSSTLEESSEDFSIESLLQRVDEFQKREQLETLEDILWRILSCKSISHAIRRTGVQR
ncbi:MAG: hypothetical protein M1840_007269 [Geoglossum simile]|nr:MAG: hypothetical protein M1840_007269 [Geoglossum simile]